jgi:hypothetical protein
VDVQLHVLDAFSSENYQVPTVQSDVWAQGSTWTGANKRKSFTRHRCFLEQNLMKFVEVAWQLDEQVKV